MSWKEEADVIARRRAMAEEMGGEERVTKHRERGYRTIRDRIAGTIDPGSFQLQEPALPQRLGISETL